MRTSGPYVPYFSVIIVFAHAVEDSPNLDE
jgi:hypothetical protein